MSNKTLRKLLPFFDPSELPEYPFIFVASSRRSGKSTVICDLILNYFHECYDFIIGLCGNAHTARQYVESGAIPEKYCHSRYTPDILREWFDRCDDLLKKGKKLPSTLFICDDVLVLNKSKGNRTTRSDPSLNKLATMGRHYSAGCILIVQSWNVGLSFVRQSDAVIVSPSSLYAGQDYKMLAEHYMTGDNHKQNREILELFGQYDWLVLRYWKATRSQRKLLSWYRVNAQSLKFSKH